MFTFGRTSKLADLRFGFAGTNIHNNGLDFYVWNTYFNVYIIGSYILPKAYFPAGFDPE